MSDGQTFVTQRDLGVIPDTQSAINRFAAEHARYVIETKCTPQGRMRYSTTVTGCFDHLADLDRARRDVSDAITVLLHFGQAVEGDGVVTLLEPRYD